MSDNNKIGFYSVEDVMRIMGIGKTTAYKRIRELNAELAKKNKAVVKGKVPKAYFHERFELDNDK